MPLATDAEIDDRQSGTAAPPAGGAADDVWYHEDEHGWVRQYQSWSGDGVYVISEENDCSPMPWHYARQRELRARDLGAGCVSPAGARQRAGGRLEHGIPALRRRRGWRRALRRRSGRRHLRQRRPGDLPRVRRDRHRADVHGHAGDGPHPPPAAARPTTRRRRRDPRVAGPRSAQRGPRTASRRHHVLLATNDRRVASPPGDRGL